MISKIQDVFFLSKKFDVAMEDVLLIDLNINGINTEMKADRVRFFVELFLGEKYKSFCALQVRKDSKYSVKKGNLYLRNECIGKVNNFETDFCDAYYMRRGDTVLNINPKSRINCQGCKFCYTSHQKSRSIIDLTVCDNLDKFFFDWISIFI